MCDVSFVPATEKDVMAIIELRRIVWGTTYRGIYPDSMIDDFDYAWHKEKELKRITALDYSVYLIRTGDLDIGYLTIRKREVVLLMSLYVIKEYQHQGIGRKAFEFVMQFCRDSEKDSFVCTCLPENHNARMFYEKMGGKIIGEDLENEESWMNSVTYQFDF